jgi:protein-L-isoaspartate(D-aspartate) O-methyltransferase
MPDLATERERMVREQIAGRGIADPATLDAFRAVPREAFVDPTLAHQAYEDHPLPIPAGQTISQPYIVALMVEAAGVRRGDRVLEVGAGSGYAAAILGRIADAVIAIERHEELAQLADERMRRLGYDNVRIVAGDGTHGWPGAAPYHAILVAAAGTEVPQALADQLAPGGRVVMPVGAPDAVQRLVRLTKGSDGRLREEELGPVRFVPLIGDERHG